MRDFDLDRLGDLWREEPEPAEIAALQRSARRARGRARLAAGIDAFVAVLLAGAVIAIVAISPQPRTLLLGGAAILVLLMGHIRKRRYREIELQALSTDSSAMLDQSIARIEARRNRTRLGLLAIGPATLLGILFAGAADEGTSGELFQRIWADPELRRAVFVGAVVALGAAVLQMAATWRRSGRELTRLRELRAAYRKEEDPQPPQSELG
jgi:hypothetical protein